MSAIEAVSGDVAEHTEFATAGVIEGFGKAQGSERLPGTDGGADDTGVVDRFMTAFFVFQSLWSRTS